MNQYLTAIEAMGVMLDPDKDPMEIFDKKHYKENFEIYYQKRVEAFDAIEELYKSVGEPDTMLENMAKALSDQGLSIVAGCRTKNKREEKMMSLNMQMAVFVFPAILHYRGESSQALCDQVSRKWKEAFPKSNVTAAEYEYIEKGFHKKFCYITTAVCETFGKPDDCYELTLLRDYRDHYLAAQPDGDEVISLYYDVAPSIVKHINRCADRGRIYQDIYDTYLSPCIHLIEQGENEQCRDLYTKMVGDLKDKYFLRQSG